MNSPKQNKSSNWPKAPWFEDGEHRPQENGPWGQWPTCPIDKNMLPLVRMLIIIPSIILCAVTVHAQG